MELSQSNQRDLQILMNCRGKEFCQGLQCPVFNGFEYKCGYERTLQVLSTMMYNAFEPEDRKPPQGELVNDRTNNN